MLDRIAALTAAATLAGCMTVGPDYKRPEVDTPQQWPVHGQAEPVSSQWWRSYGDPVLERMVEEALVHNLDLRQAIARVAEARAQLGVSRADQYPGVTAGADAADVPDHLRRQVLVLEVDAGVDHRDRRAGAPGGGPGRRRTDGVEPPLEPLLVDGVVRGGAALRGGGRDRGHQGGARAEHDEPTGSARHPEHSPTP